MLVKHHSKIIKNMFFRRKKSTCHRCTTEKFGLGMHQDPISNRNPSTHKKEKNTSMEFWRSAAQGAACKLSIHNLQQHASTMWATGQVIYRICLLDWDPYTWMPTPTYDTCPICHGSSRGQQAVIMLHLLTPLPLDKSRCPRLHICGKAAKQMWDALFFNVAPYPN